MNHNLTLEDLELNEFDNLNITDIKLSQTGGSSNKDDTSSSSSIDPDNTNSNSSIDPEAESNESQEIELGEPQEVELGEPQEIELGEPPLDVDKQTVQNNKLKKKLTNLVNSINPVNITLKELSEEKSNNSKLNLDEDEAIFEEDLIIDDEDFIIQETKEDIEIIEQEIIPENKIVANDLDQNDDLINELVKLNKSKYKNKIYLRKITNSVNHFNKLKYTHSSIENGEIITAKFKGDNYNKLLDEFQTNKSWLSNLKNYGYIPCVNQKKDLYNIVEDENTILESDNLDSIDDDKITKKDNSSEINKHVELRNKFKKTNSRINYSYKKEINTLHNITNNYENINSNNTYETKINENLHVCDPNKLTLSKNKFTYNSNIVHILNGDTNISRENGSEDVLVEGEDISINGFMRIPRDKLNFKSLNNNKLVDVVNNELFNNNILFENLKSFNEEIVNVDYSVNSKVKIFNISDKSVINGIIEQFDSNILSVKINDGEIENIIQVDIDEPNIQVININESDRTNLLDDENIFKRFSFSTSGNNVNKSNNTYLKELFKEITPNTNSISNLFEELDDIELQSFVDYLKYYNLNIDDLTHNNFNTINTKNTQNIDKDIDESYKKEDVFQDFIRQPPKIVQQKIPIITNYLLKSCEPYYGVYPYYQSNIDSIQSRLRWLISKKDNGNLFFLKIIRSIQEKIHNNPMEYIKKLESEVGILSREISDLDILIDGEVTKIVAEKNKCLNIYIAKEYTSLETLQSDNNKIIKIDHDKRMAYIKGDNVLDGHHAILKLPDKTQLFKRITLTNDSQIWNLEDALEIDPIIKSNKDLCNQQSQSLNEIQNIIKDMKRCSFSNIENQCLPKTLTDNIILSDLKHKEIFEKTTNINQLKESLNEKDTSDTNIKYHEYYLDLVNNQSKNIYIDKKNEAKTIIPVNPEYEMLYKKIDLYLEKINKLSDDIKYNLLELLINKYGRSYNIKDNENSKNIYCKYGNKVLCCNHNSYLIKINKNVSPENNKQIYDSVITEYGIENDGKIWCNNCGVEIFPSDYELSEGFKKNGARDITHEVIQEEVYESKYENSDLVESIKMHLTDDKDKVDNDIVDIYNIIKIITNIMGIKLDDTDSLTLIKNCENLCETNIKSKDTWLPSFKGKPKSSDKAYNNYKNINVIIYTICNLFIVLQSAIPEYKITKPHNKCISSLDGFPLNGNNSLGLDYVTCILEQLRQINTNYECLKKLKINALLQSTITKLIQDENISHKYNLKRQYLSTVKKELSVKSKNNWNQFKPPLFLFDINNESFNSKEISPTENLDALSNYYSLKFISNVDKIINDSSIENYIFSPSVLSYSCCLNNVSDYNYLETLIKTDNTIKTINNKLNKIENLQNISNKNTKVLIRNDEYIEPVSFSNIVYPLEPDITQHKIRNLYELYTLEGETRVYKNNICLLTGENKDVINTKTYILEDYYKLLENINKKKSLIMNYKDTPINSLNQLKKIIKQNVYLNTNAYLQKFIVYIESKNKKEEIDKGWTDFNQQIKVEIDEINELLNSKLETGKIKTIITLLTNLGILNNIYDENNELYNKEYAENILSNDKIKLIHKFNYLLISIMSKIKCDSLEEDVYIPTNWKIEITYKKLLNDHILKNNKLIEKYITKKNDSNSQKIFNSVIDIIQHHTNDINNIIGEEHVYNCKGQIEFYSKFTNKNASQLLHFIFVILFKNIINYNSLAQSPQSQSQSVKIVNPDEDLEITLGLSIDEPTELSNSELNLLENLDETTSTTHQTMVINLLYDILEVINKSQEYSDKHTQTHMNKVINKQYDESKEDSLKFIETLDKEARQSLNTMISLGLDTWKDLFKKNDSNLYFDKPDEEPSDDTELADIVYNDVEKDNINRDKAKETLGEDYSEESYQDWLQNYNSGNQEEYAALNEHVMMDDDGDFQGDDDYDGY